MFQKINAKERFPEIEKKVLDKWKKDKSFEKSLKEGKNCEEFVFFDGPPFATGLPHYGHILAGTIKDVIPRYKTMKGFKVDRKFGWDCHGLPVENLIEKNLGLNDRKQILEFGEGNFNEECRSSVLKYTGEWEKIVGKMGRWVDFKGGYKTMDKDFMQSVWWVFKEIWEKDLVYKGNKPMHICPRCVTPLSNFEVNQGYKDLTDLSVVGKFRINSNKCGHEVDFLAWTTTPWTLPGNVALAVGEEIEYSFMKKGNHVFVLAKETIGNFKKELDGYEEFQVKKGKDLLKMTYDPIFNYFEKEKENGGFQIVLGDFVTTQSGTGIVHIAPAFGEDDMKLGKEKGLPFIKHVEMNGEFIKEVKDFAGELVKSKDDNMKMDRKIVEFLEKNDKVFQKKSLKHSYPTCWRCETPLLNYATETWFIKVEEIKDRLSKNNQKINWTPNHIKDGRFGKWLEGARDWAFSRNRYWGTPIPIWQNDKTGNFKCIGSVDELEKLSGKKVDDLHKHFIDKVDFQIDGEEGTYKRIEEIFDCWFESGAMPFASKGYPFNENIILNNQYFIARHGISTHNDQNILSCNLEGNEKHTLTEKGRENTEENAEKFDEKFDLIISSPFERCLQTAKIYQKHKGGELIIDERISEHNMALNGEKLEKWIDYKKKNDPWTTCIKGGETGKDILERIKNIFEEYNEKYKGKKILFVSHKRIVSILTNYLKGKEGYFDENIPNSTILPLVSKTGFKLPANFIAEGMDQTRGWFYTLHILSTILVDEPAFKNVIVNGIILAEDGQKMSKSKQNYPDPDLIFQKYGADAMRFYLINSPVVAGENFRFAEKGVEQVCKKILLPLWNSYSFFMTYAEIDKIEIDKIDKIDKENLSELNKWILSELEIVTKEVSEKLENYDLFGAAKVFPKFFDNITNWYIRRSRKIFWSKNYGKNSSEKIQSYQTLYKVLMETSKLLAPFCPFLTEEIFEKLSGKKDSVHLETFPEISKNFIDEKLSKEIFLIQEIISLGLSLRKKLELKVRQPLQKIIIFGDEKVLKKYEKEILEELNVKEIEILKDFSEIAEKVVVPNSKVLGPRFGKKVQEIIKNAKEGNFKELENGNFEILGEEITNKEIEIRFIGKKGEELNTKGNLIVSFDTKITEILKLEGISRDIVRAVSEFRKEKDFEITDRIILEIGNKKIVENFGKYICDEVLGEIGQVSGEKFVVEGVEIGVKRK